MTSENRILQSQRSNVTSLERARVFVEGERVVFAKAQDGRQFTWAIPHVNTSILLLGQGTSITQDAARRLADEKVLVAFTGTGGTPIFMGAVSEYAPTEHLRRWISIWPRPEARLAAAKELARARLRAVTENWKEAKIARHQALETFAGALEEARSVEALRGHEGAFAKATYVHVAKCLGVQWSGRTKGEPSAQSRANRFLDQGNYLAYGLAGVVLWALGIPPGLAVNHGATRAGGLVFDLADAVKDAVVLPCAFSCARKGCNSSEFRDEMITKLDVSACLPTLFDAIERCLVKAEMA